MFSDGTTYLKPTIQMYVGEKHTNRYLALFGIQMEKNVHRILYNNC